MIERVQPVETIDTGQEWRRLRTLHDWMATFLEDTEAVLWEVAPAVSAWPAAAHLYHVSTANFGVARSIVRLLGGSLAASTSARRDASVALVLGGAIPRGVPAPEGLVPPAGLDRAAVGKRVSGARSAVEALAPLLDDIAASEAAFDHPYLGPLTPAVWLRFMNVHTVHHLRIVERIPEGG